jgi:hypothetical protein
MCGSASLWCQSRSRFEIGWVKRHWTVDSYSFAKQQFLNELRDHEIPRNSAKITKVFRENMRNFDKILPRNFAEFRRNSAKKMFYFVQFRISRNNQIPISWPPYFHREIGPLRVPKKHRRLYGSLTVRMIPLTPPLPCHFTIPLRSPEIDSKLRAILESLFRGRESWNKKKTKRFFCRWNCPPPFCELNGSPLFPLPQSSFSLCVGIGAFPGRLDPIHTKKAGPSFSTLVPLLQRVS